MNKDNLSKYLLERRNRTKSKKKTFTPNLNVIRKKHFTKCKYKQEIENEKRNNRIQSFLKTKKFNIVDKYKQTSSVFSEGPWQIMKFPRSRTVTKVEKVPEGKKMSNTKSCLLNRNEISEDIILENLSGCYTKEDDSKMGPEPPELEKKVTLSSLHHSCLNRNAKTIFPAPIKEEDKYSPIFFLNEKLYSQEHPSLNVIKLPYYFTNKQMKVGKPEEVADPPLAGFPDGKIGKLLVRRSGKIEADIASMKYNVNDVSAFFSDYDLINFVPSGNSVKSDLVVLDKISNWFAFVPNWHTLVK